MNTIRTNTTAIDLRAALIAQEVSKAEALQEDMAKKFWPMIGTANKVAYFAIEDAVDMMREAGMLRQKQKVNALRAMDELNKYERNAYEHFMAISDDRYALWQDLVGRAAEKLQPDVQRLYFAIKNVIDRHRVKHSDVLAQIQTGVALITLSTLMFDTMANQYQRLTMVEIRDTFRGGRLTAVESNWKAVGEITGRQVMADVDLRNDPACQLGVQVILTRYQDMGFLNEAAGEALRLNPQVLHHLEEKETTK